jgi:hypothetical protein
MESFMQASHSQWHANHAWPKKYLRNEQLLGYQPFANSKSTSPTLTKSRACGKIPSPPRGTVPESRANSTTFLLRHLRTYSATSVQNPLWKTGNPAGAGLFTLCVFRIENRRLKARKWLD